jgi:hypothetical protein
MTTTHAHQWGVKDKCDHDICGEYCEQRGCSAKRLYNSELVVYRHKLISGKWLAWSEKDENIIGGGNTEDEAIRKLLEIYNIKE